VPQDDVEAARWYRKAADQGHPAAQCSLGVCYSKGEGVVQDHPEAVKWYRKAGEHGLALAQCDLGVCYEKGEGVPQDSVEAYKWFSLAAAQGHEDAKRAKLSLTHKMTPEQIADGFRRVRNFKPSRATESGASAPSH
jgi:TPR repeat protein